MACQEESFGDEIETIRNKEHVKSSSCLYKLSPFFNEFGVIRIRGRIYLARYKETGNIAKGSYHNKSYY